MYVDSCVFKNIGGGIYLTVYTTNAKVVNVTVKNSNFSGSRGQAMKLIGSPSGRTTSSTLFMVLFQNLLVEKNSFIGESSGAAISVVFNSFKDIILEITNSSFIKNQNQQSYSPLNRQAGALLIAMPTDTMTFPGCVEFRRVHRKWNYTNKVLILNTSFENNVGLTGALYISNGDAKCINCRFKDNFVTSRSGQVHLGEDSGRLELINSTFLETYAASTFSPKNVDRKNKFQLSAFIFSSSAGPLLITGTLFRSEVSKQRNPVIVISKGGVVKMANQSSLLCPTGSKLVMEDFSHFVTTEYAKWDCKILVTVLTVSCQACPIGMYSLQRGNITSMSATTEGFRCLACPYGANCNHNVAAKKNFWGYKISTNPPQLLFVMCPAGYCSVPNTRNTAVFNDCYGNREGKLCGRCKQGFTEDLVSTSCIDETKCNSWLFWCLLFLFSFLMAFYFLFQPTIFRLVYTQIMWLKKQDNHGGFTNAGYTKILFYFYQIAAVLVIETYMELVGKRIKTFLSVIISAFSFCITFGSSKTTACPFIGMTPVTKVIFTNMGVLTILLCIFIIFIAHMMYCKVKRNSIDQIPYLAATLELLLLGYANFAKATLKLFTCVVIGSESVLFIDGNTPCWQWRKFVLGILLAFFMFPFIFVLYWVSTRHRRQKLSPIETLLALVLPIPYFICKGCNYFKTLCRNQSGMSENQDKKWMEATRFTEVLHGPFRMPTEENKGTLYWESVLVGRRLFLLCIHALVINPLNRMFWLSLTCVAIYTHHLLMFPFKEAKANYLEAISLFALVVIANINLIKAVLWSDGVNPGGPDLPRMKTLEWIEVVLLGFFPAIFAVLFAGFVISLLVRAVFNLAKCLRNCFAFLKTFIVLEENQALITNESDISDREISSRKVLTYGIFALGSGGRENGWVNENSKT